MATTTTAERKRKHAGGSADDSDAQEERTRAVRPRTMDGKREVRIGFTGLAEAGKTTATRHLVERYGAKPYMLAGPLKRLIVELFGIDVEWVMDGKLKEQELPEWGESPRRLMQEIGTMFREQLAKRLPNLAWSSSTRNNFWIELLHRKLQRDRRGAPAADAAADGKAEPLDVCDGVTASLFGLEPRHFLDAHLRHTVCAEWGDTPAHLSSEMEEMFRVDLPRRLPNLKLDAGQGNVWIEVAARRQAERARSGSPLAAATTGSASPTDRRPGLSVVSDVRMPDEYAYLHSGEAVGSDSGPTAARVIRLVRQAPNHLSAIAKMHSSEQGSPEDVTIENNGSLAELLAALDREMLDMGVEPSAGRETVYDEARVIMQD